MGRSNPDSFVRSPVASNIYFHGTKGLARYQKAANGGREFVDVKQPFKFVVLENKIFRIAGRDKVRQEKLKSKMYRQGTNPLVEVRHIESNGLAFSGRWPENKEEIKALGGRFEQCLFIMNDDKDIEVLYLHGLSVKQWYDYLKANGDLNPLSNVVFNINGTTVVQDKDGNDRNVPVFGHQEIPEDNETLLAEANQRDVLVQKYLKHHMNYHTSEAPQDQDIVAGRSGQEEQPTTKTYPIPDPEESTPNVKDFNLSQEEWIDQLTHDITEAVGRIEDFRTIWSEVAKKAATFVQEESQKVAITGIMQSHIDKTFGEEMYIAKIDGIIEDDLPF